MNYSDAVSVIKGEKTLDSTLATQDSQPEVPMEQEVPLEKNETEANTAAPEENNGEFPEGSESTEDGNEEAAIDAPEKGNKGKTSKKKRDYTPMEKQRYAFKLQKARWQKAEAALKAQEEENEKLKAELEKYKGLTLEDFGNDQEKYMDYKLDQRMGRERLDSMTKQVEDQRMQMQMQEAAEMANERLMNCFPDEAERDKYQALIQNAESRFAEMHPEIGFEKFSDFLLSEKDRSVLQYLQDSDNAPKLIRHFIHKPEAALRIMTMRSPYSKFIELKQLENRMMQHERIVKNKTVAPAKKTLPDIGKTLNNNAIESGPDFSRPWSKQDAINWIANHK